MVKRTVLTVVGVLVLIHVCPLEAPALLPSRLTGVQIEDAHGPRAASPQEIHRHVRIVRDGRRIPAYIGMPLEPGDEVEISGFVNLTLDYRGDEIILHHDTRVRLSREAHDIYSYFGELWVFVRGLAGRFSVHGEAFTAGAGSTRFYVKVDPMARKPEVIVESGWVRVRFDAPSEPSVVLNTYDAFLDGQVYKAVQSYARIGRSYGSYRPSVGRTGLDGVAVPRVNSQAVSPGPRVAKRLKEIRRWVNPLHRGAGSPVDASPPPEQDPVHGYDRPGRPGRGDRQDKSGGTQYLPLTEFGIRVSTSNPYAGSNIGKVFRGYVSNGLKAGVAIGFRRSREGEPVRVIHRGGGWVDVSNPKTGETARIQVTETIP